MEMKAITDHFGIEDAPRMALQAGCDLLIYRSEGEGRHAYASLLKDLENGKLGPERVLESAKRSQDIKREYLLPFTAHAPNNWKEVVGCPAHLELVSKFS